jgi:hypothetical protein
MNGNYAVGYADDISVLINGKLRAGLAQAV